MIMLVFGSKRTKKWWWGFLFFIQFFSDWSKYFSCNDIKVQVVLVFIRFQIKISRPFKKCRFLVSRWSCLLLSGLIGTPACLSNNLSWQIRVTIHTQTKFSMWIILSSSQKVALNSGICVKLHLMLLKLFWRI